MKEITLKITGKQADSVTLEDQMEFVTEGRLEVQGETLVISYEESELSGMPGCITEMTVSGQVIRMSRTGDCLSVGTEILFEKGRRYTGTYDTPYGPVRMEVLTTQVENTIGRGEKGHLAIDYDISLQGISEGHSRLELEIL